VSGNINNRGERGDENERRSAPAMRHLRSDPAAKRVPPEHDSVVTYASSRGFAESGLRVRVEPSFGRHSLHGPPVAPVFDEERTEVVVDDHRGERDVVINRATPSMEVGDDAFAGRGRKPQRMYRHAVRRVKVEYLGTGRRGGVARRWRVDEAAGTDTKGDAENCVCAGDCEQNS